MTFVVLVVILALVFDFINGMNDAANSIATIVSTRVLGPLQAVLWAAFFNFSAAFLLNTAVADTISQIVRPEVPGPGGETFRVVTGAMVLAGLVGAILWSHFCTRAGLPISVSHALIGGVLGAALARCGPSMGLEAMRGDTVLKVAAFIVLSPVLGFVGGFLLMVGVHWAFRSRGRRQVGGLFRGGQLLSSAAFSFSHGANDAQKTMGIILMALVAAGMHTAGSPAPAWVVLSAYLAIAAGTVVGGWKVIHTVGTRLTRLQPQGGFCAETSGAAVCLGTALAGIPVSTTHTIVGCILGVGATRRVGAVRWEVAGRIIWAWVLTLPCSAILGAAAWWAVDAARLDALVGG